MSIGERISSLRKERNISQGDLARMLEVTRQAVSKWENDLSSPDTLKLIRLADVLNTDVEYLATGVKPVYERPVVVNVIKKSDEVVERIVEKPVVQRIIRVRYRSDPLVLSIVSVVMFLLGLLCGILIV